MNENKTNINWLITVYSNFWRKPLFIRKNSKIDFASFSKKERKIIKNRLKYTYF